MATENMEEGHESFTKISDFAKHWSLLRPMSMSISFFMGNFYQSNVKMSNKLLCRSMSKFIPNASLAVKALQLSAFDADHPVMMISPFVVLACYSLSNIF